MTLSLIFCFSALEEQSAMTLELQGMSRSISHRTSITFFSMTGSILFSSDVAGAVLGVVDGMVFTGLEVSDLIFDFVSENKCF